MGIKKAFTLAEVLVTLGIIGVVSAMTIPSLTQNWQKRAYVTQLHKVYSEFQQGFISQMNKTNAVNLYESGLITAKLDMANPDVGAMMTSVWQVAESFLKKNFKVIKDCGTEEIPCFASSYKSLNGDTVRLATGGYNIVNSNGVAIKMYFAADFTPSENNNMGAIIVDINGPKGPNIIGRDYFEMDFNMDGSIDVEGAGINCKKYSTHCGSYADVNALRNGLYNSGCKDGSEPSGCFGKILNDNWEMKY